MNRKNQLTISQKVWLLCGFLMATIVGVGGISFVNSVKLERQMENISNVQLPAVRNMTLVDMMHDGIKAVMLQSILAGNNNDQSEIAAARADFKEMSANVQQYLNEIQSLPIEPETQKAITASIPELEHYIATTDKIISNIERGETEAASSLIPAFRTSFDKLEEKLEYLGERIEKDADTSRKNGERLAFISNKINLLVLILGVSIGSILSYLFIRGIVKNILSIVEKMREGADTLDRTSDGFVDSTFQLSEASSEQASAIQETVSTLDEINAMVNRSVDNANKTAELSQNSLKGSTEGQKAMEEMVNAIQEISQSNENIMNQIELSNKQFGEITNVIGEISEKTKVINDIVFQTKLLSFNASVEAARAGEHGKGFAVVAEEVGNLAQMSGKAAEEISGMLEASSNKVNGIIQETQSKVNSLVETGKEKVEYGVSVAARCGEILNEVVENVTVVNKNMSEVLMSSREQAQGVSNITEAMNQLETTTHANASQAQLNTKRTEELKSQATQLREAVSSLESILVRNVNKLQRHSSVAETENRGFADNVTVLQEKMQARSNSSNDNAFKSTLKVAGSNVQPSNNDPRFEDL